MHLHRHRLGAPRAGPGWSDRVAGRVACGSRAGSRAGGRAAGSLDLPQVLVGPADPGRALGAGAADAAQDAVGEDADQAHRGGVGVEGQAAVRPGTRGRRWRGGCVPGGGRVGDEHDVRAGGDPPLQQQGEAARPAPEAHDDHDVARGPRSASSSPTTWPGSGARRTSGRPARAAGAGGARPRWLLRQPTTSTRRASASSSTARAIGGLAEGHGDRRGLRLRLLRRGAALVDAARLPRRAQRAQVVAHLVEAGEAEAAEESAHRRLGHPGQSASSAAR